LRFSGYDIVEANSGGEAIEKAASAQPGLILLDLNLPDMKGLDAARAIRRNQRTAHIPVIACSAFGENEREEALRSGMVDYLRKPFSGRGSKSKSRRIYPALIETNQPKKFASRKNTAPSDIALNARGCVLAYTVFKEGR
jgi:two-component system, cell cycle response regulator DivK